MSKPRLIEKGKNLSLVVLFLSTILLLYFFWGNISFGTLKSPPAQAAGTGRDLAELLKPDRIVVNLGEDNYTVVPPGERWYSASDQDSFVNELIRFGSAEDILVEEITGDQYEQAMKFESIRAEFRYNVPTSDFCSVYNVDKPQSYALIDSMNELAYSAAGDGNSLFIKDGKNQKYYHLIADNKAADADKGKTAENAEFQALITSIETEGYNSYYPVGSYLGVENNALVPLSIDANLKSFSYRQDAYSFQTDKISYLAEKFFGRNFDFVRKITEEDGTIIYMYGYGQNVLIVNTDGSIEYKEEQIEANNNQSFSDALETAIKFIDNHGSWKSLEGAEMTPYLKNMIRNPNKKEGYRFVFGMEVNGSRIYYEDGDPITVDVTSGQVTYFKRNLIDFDPEDLEAIETASAEPAFSTANLIAQNYKYIYDVLLQSGKVAETADQTAMFEVIAAMVNNMQPGYVKQAGEQSMEIQPAWIVSIGGDGAEFYFDLYTANPIGFSKE